MEWEVVKITANKKGRNSPYASVGHGRITLSAGACDLIPNFREYEYAQLLRGRRNNKLCIGIKLFKESVQDTIKIKRRVSNGKEINTAEIGNKMVIGELFGIAGTERATTRYSVEKIEDNFLMIYSE